MDRKTEIQVKIKQLQIENQCRGDAYIYHRRKANKLWKKVDETCEEIATLELELGTC